MPKEKIITAKQLADIINGLPDPNNVTEKYLNMAVMPLDVESSLAQIQFERSQTRLGYKWILRFGE